MSILDHVVVSDLRCHCILHAHYPSTVPHVISSAADLLMLVQPRRMRRTAQRVSYRQNTVVKTNRQVRNFRRMVPLN